MNSLAIGFAFYAEIFFMVSYSNEIKITIVLFVLVLICMKNRLDDAREFVSQCWYVPISFPRHQQIA